MITMGQMRSCLNKVLQSIEKHSHMVLTHHKYYYDAAQTDPLSLLKQPF